ncbi:MAG: GAF domain-containing protein [Clostridia bacterium]|nr:GAF domain-containing protein [Clostridia bacterium]
MEEQSVYDRFPGYPLLWEQARALIQDVPHLTANLSNLSALLFASLERINWAGFYLLEGETLVLGPFQGRPACIEIPLGKGVCGTAAAQDKTQLVDDVHAFPGHIPCDSASRSELVVPLHGKTGVAGVLDIDSPYPARFTEEDKTGLEQFARVIEQTLSDLL